MSLWGYLITLKSGVIITSHPLKKIAAMQNGGNRILEFLKVCVSLESKSRIVSLLKWIRIRRTISTSLTQIKDLSKTQIEIITLEISCNIKKE
jgi:hypothetical protein